MIPRFVDTPLLRIAYETAGPERGFPVILAHGWPDDPRTWDAILPALHDAGFRTYALWLRGYGPTRFASAATFRSGQLVALGEDLVDFASALGLGRHALVGHDWGSRAAYIASSLNEANVAACVALSTGYGTNSPSQKLSYRQTQNYWYHWLMATRRGERLVREDRRAFTRHIWNEWFVAYKPGDSEFDRTAASFDNPDWADVTLHSYRVRWGHAESDPRYAEIESRFDPAPKQRVPTLTLHGALDPVNSPQMSEGKEGYFIGPYERRLIAGAGHFPQRECPHDVAPQVIDWLRRYRE
jgi:pimeloyl-ACP methyl ester carboxylesterase